MRIARPTTLVLIALALAPANVSNGWGFKGHDMVTSRAVDVLPRDLKAFYEPNRRWVVALCVLPDEWRDTHMDEERFHHFVDLEYYSSAPGFSDIPRSFKAAERRYGRENMLKWGVLPWTITGRSYLLAQAFRRGDLEEIVVQSALISHYVADMHNPLHNTRFYEGRSPEQKGLHHRFEVNLVNDFIQPDEIEPGSPEAVSDPWRSVFSWMVGSYGAIDSLNKADTDAAAEAARGSERYNAAFTSAAEPIARRQLSLAASRLAGLYVWAWNRAGSPPLPAKSAPLFWGR